MPRDPKQGCPRHCASLEMQVTGVITLEDILEEVIKAEIIDEHDTFVANDSMQKVHKVCT